MNFTLFFVRSTWVAVAVAILMPTLAQSTDAATPPAVKQSQDITGTNPASNIDNLNPNPNPLQFPTKPEEVRIQRTVPLTLAQALELARRNNRTLQVAILQLQRSQSAVREAQAALLPNANLSTNLTNNGPGFSGGNSSTTSFNGQAQLNYDLYTSGNRQANIRAAEEQVRVDELNVENQSLVIGLNVSTQYYNLQGADEQVRINQAAVANAQASLRDTQARLQAGVGTQFDVLQAQVNLANAQQQLTLALSQQQIARRQFGTLLSLPQSVDVTAADPVRIAGLWPQTLEQTIVQAFQNRPELPQQLAQRNIAEQQRRQALSQLGPQIGVTGRYSLLDQFNDNISVADGYSVGLQANLTLFDGGAARARAAQSRANIAIAETNFASQRDQIRFDVEQFYFQLQSNLDNVQTSTVALEQAREALRIARLRFQAGVGTQTEVIAAENDLTRAEGNRVSAILDYNRALANLQRSVTSRAAR
ncbi:TolC family protein [Calothrix sp. NIES-2098]|uniref:TolC family protein n=1 Tax=Calothrix sp. NIES-2098 TaxID=1954171 RepID=UPI000B604DFB|nr:outer membrane efflux protein [Calothrix sp. NIES-2098]